MSLQLNYHGNHAEDEILPEENNCPVNEKDGREIVGKMKEEFEDEEEESLTRGECGVLGFKPSFLQPCAQPFSFAIVYSFTALLTSTLFTYINSQVTTLERQFGFNSSQTGLIMAANDIGYLSTCIIFSYLAVRVNIPRTLGIVTVLFGISGLLCSLPHFLFGPRAAVTVDDVNGALMTSSAKKAFETFGQLCLEGAGNRTMDNCSLEDTKSQTSGSIMHENSQTALFLIMAGMIIQGICKSPRMPFAMFYVDSNLKNKTKTGFYMGIVIALGIFGPVLAFVLGGIFTKYHVSLQATNLTPRHPRWIGAWWLGFLVFGAASIVSALPIFLFPAWLRGKKPDFSSPPTSTTKTASTTRITTTARTASASNRRTKIMQEGKEFLGAIRRLVTNFVYVCVLLSGCAEVFSAGGQHAFLPKYLEVQFSLPTWQANLSLAVTSMSTAAIGTFIGGWLTRHFKMTLVTILKLNCCLSMVGVIATCGEFFVKCIQATIFNRPSEIPTTASCIGGCSCDGAEFSPVCGSDYHTYYSPCHAGCLTALDEVSYTNCSCIPDGSATPGICDYGCYSFYIYMAVQAASALCGTIALMPKVLVYIRCVEPRDKALAMGCASFMSSLLGWLLGPVIFGKMIDGVCDVWEESTCSGRGSCLLYDNDSFRVLLHSLVLAGRGTAFLLVMAAFLKARKSKRYNTWNAGDGVAAFLGNSNHKRDDNFIAID